MQLDDDTITEKGNENELIQNFEHQDNQMDV